MIDLQTIWTAAYATVLVGFSVYGLHRYYLLYLLGAHRRNDPAPAPAPVPLPRVTVQLPIFNEGKIVVRLLDAVGNLDYPRELLDVQILDDSTDETTELCRRGAEQLRERGFAVELLHRSERTGYKAGALAEGMESAHGEFIFILDADFVPGGDVLLRMLGNFSDRNVGMVQARWGHMNRGESLLTRVEAIVLDAHFLIEQVARSRSGRFISFNGTAGIWRRSCIEEAGGWEHDTLTEDLDLSYRAQLAGWKFVYLREVVVPGELPANMGAYQTQQHRWTKGAVQTLKKLLPRILGSSLPLPAKIGALAHLSGNLVYLLMGGFFLLLWPWGGELPWSESVTGAISLGVFLLAFVSVGAFYFVAICARGERRCWRDLATLPVVLAMGVGMSVNGLRAVGEALANRTSPFVRTPKSGGGGICRGWGTGDFGQALVEMGMVVYTAVLAWMAARSGAWLALPFLLMFHAGFAYVTVRLRWRSPSLRHEALIDNNGRSDRLGGVEI